MDKKQIGEAVKRKRSALGWSQEHLGWKSTVSSNLIGKIEKGDNVKDENLAKVLLTLGMKEQLHKHREDLKVVNYKALTLEELRTVIQSCKDFIRDGDTSLKIEVASFKKTAEKELLKRLREYFRGTDLD
jgi:transcriptional regulator with XRE-family HTH domain